MSSSEEEAKDGNRTIQFLKQHADTWLKFDLLLFWNRHPHARFTPGTIARTLGHRGKAEVREALDSFVNEKIVEKYTQQGLPFYCLTADPDKRQFVLNAPAYRSKLRPAISIQ